MIKQKSPSLLCLAFLVLFLLIKSIFMIGVILYAQIGLGPDEAQYWGWSRLLDWGYYSKPPGIAWQIRLGTQFFGQTELGVRIGSVVFSFLISLATYALARACRLQFMTAFWAAIIISLTPLGFLSSLFAITDIGQVFFWIMATYFVADALSDEERSPNYIAVGLMIMLGALFKWNIYLFWPLLILFMPFYPQLFSSTFFVGVLISSLGLLPSVIWNSTHEWVTFKHVFSTVTSLTYEESTTKGNFFDFVGAQIGLVSPIIFLLLLISFGYLIAHSRKILPSLVFCGASSLIILLSFSIAAIYKKMQGNWADFAYPSAIVFLSWYAFEKRTLGFWIKLGLMTSVLCVVYVLSIPRLEPKYAIPYKMNPFKHNLGWNELGKIFTKIGYNPDTEFLFADKYQISSILGFYAPGQRRAYFMNLHQIRLNQFSFWPSMAEEQIGKSGYFVWVENSPHLEKNVSSQMQWIQNALQPYFKTVQFLGLFPLYENGEALAKGALIFKGIEYNGLEPERAEKF